MHHFRLVLLFALAFGFLPIGGTGAQEPESGKADRSSVDVGSSCVAAASAALDEARASVDPIGSPSYGLALVSGIQKGTRNTRSVICVIDRETQRVEIGSLIVLADAVDAVANFPVENGKASPATAATLIYPGSATCRQNCLAHWTALSAADQDQLSALPEQVRRTLAETSLGIEEPSIREADAAARAVVAAAGGSPDDRTARDLSGIEPGSRRCTHYWFGYQGGPGRVEDEFDCKVDRLSNGGLNVMRTSGKESLVYQVQMLGTGLAVIGGRDAPAGPSPDGYDLSRPLDPFDPNYGNEVGLGIACTDGRFYAVSINERGIEPKDPSFFQMVAVEPPARP